MHEASPDGDEEIVGSAGIDEAAEIGGNDRSTRVTWAAGFFDGEGTVGMIALKSGSRSLRIGVGQLVRRPLETLSALWGGSIVLDTSEDKPFWRWTITADRAMGALREMLPHLQVKAEQAEIGIEFQAGKAGRPRLYQDSKKRQRDYMRLRRAGKPWPNAGGLVRPTVEPAERDRWKPFMVRIQQARP